jgi:gliding motility-associated protein GldM
MAGGKLSPRQKMINMMYLVLTALLAMNVSKEILNSFALLNNGLVKTNINFAAKNEVTYSNFETALLNDPNKVRPFHDKAKAVKKRSQEMFDYIEAIKTELITEVEEKTETTIQGKNGQDSTIKIASDVLHMEGKDNNVIPTHYFMGDLDKAAPGNKAFEFKEKITKFKEDLIANIPAKEKKNIKLGLETNDVWSNHESMMISWESNNFYHNPAVAVIAILTKMQNDVKNAEADIINALYKQIDVSSFKFDTLSARVVANSNYVLLGDEYRAEVFMAAFSTTSNPQIWLGNVDSVKNEFVGPKDTSSVKVNKGVGIYTISPSSEGTVQWGGMIRMKDPADPTVIHSYPFKSEFKAARPAIVVSPDKMNVFYVGIDNPVSISVPGIAAEDIVPSMSGGSISGARGKYTVKVAQAMSGKKCMVNVSARTKNGVKSMGKGIEFRVKTVPNPVPTVYGKRGTETIKAGEIQFIKGVVPMMDNFEFELKFPVISFDVSMNVNGLEVTETSQGASLSEKAAGLIKRAKKGNKIYIEKVKVQKPGGVVTEIGSVNLKVI